MKPKSYANAPRLPEGENITVASVIPGDGAVMLEIGPGRGMFALSYATLHPGERVLALEIRKKLAFTLDARLQSKGLTHARCFAEDAGEALPRLGPDASVARAAVHFPDPWWKKRHAKRLVVQDGLVSELARLIVPGGEVFVQTDVEDRATEYAARFEASEHFENIAGAGQFVQESPYAPSRSNREARAIVDGLPVWRMVFRRR